MNTHERNKKMNWSCLKRDNPTFKNIKDNYLSDKIIINIKLQLNTLCVFERVRGRVQNQSWSRWVTWLRDKPETINWAFSDTLILILSLSLSVALFSISILHKLFDLDQEREKERVRERESVREKDIYREKSSSLFIAVA